MIGKKMNQRKLASRWMDVLVPMAERYIRELSKKATL